jgi:hypothetical protein
MAKDRDQIRLFGTSDRVELLATIVMALAAIFTAWAAFESAKWSGEQATNFSRAGASRTESTRFDTRAGQLAGIDVALFTSWLDAFNSDRTAGLISYGPGDLYEPADGTISGFLFERMRPEFQPAMDAWLIEFAEDPETAAPTPFAMPEYQLADAAEAQRLQQQADDFAAAAGQANQNSDDYVLTVVAFALVLFFVGVSSKLANERNSLLAVIIATAMFIGTTIVLFSLPKIWPF